MVRREYSLQWRWLGLALVLILGWGGTSLAQAGSTSTDVYARAVVNGYLTSLKSTLGDTNTPAHFYLSSAAAESGLAAELAADGLTGYQLETTTLVNESTWLIAVTLEPGGEGVTLTAADVDGRWLITALAPAAMPPVITTVPAADASSTTALPTAEIITSNLNVRSGPGTGYAVASVLSQGAQVQVLARNDAGDWYQVAQNGETLGWISAWSGYVSLLDEATAIPATGTDSAPAVTGAGDKLILQPESGGPFYLYEIGGTDLQYLDSGIDPTVSPDGTQVAFTRWRSSGDSVWVYDLAKGESWQVLGETAQAKSPTWSADGTQLVVNFQHGGRPQIETICAEPGSRPPREAYDINIGSDTGRVCYKLPADAHWSLRLINLADGSYEDLPTTTYAKAPTWDPSNTWRVVFAADSGLQQLDLAQLTYFPLTDDPRDHAPVFSPDGTQLAVSYQQHQHWEIYTLDMTDGSRTRLTESPLFADTVQNSAAPAWSPDGSQIAFVSDRGGAWAFWVMNADGGNVRALLPDDLAAELILTYNGMEERLITWFE